MTILDALKSVTNYPIQDNTIEKICVIRGLVSSTTLTLEIAKSEAYELAEADIYLFLYTAPSVSEQEVSFNMQDRNSFLSLANKIYSKYGDANFSGNSFGFIGENFNG